MRLRMLTLPDFLHIRLNHRRRLQQIRWLGKLTLGLLNWQLGQELLDLRCRAVFQLLSQIYQQLTRTFGILIFHCCIICRAYMALDQFTGFRFANV